MVFTRAIKIQTLSQSVVKVINYENIMNLKRTVARSHRNVRRASRAWRTRQVNTPRVRRAFVEHFSDAPHAQDNLSKLLTALSAIAAPSAGTLQNLCTFFSKGAGARGGDGGDRCKQL